MSTVNDIMNLQRRGVATLFFVQIFSTLAFSVLYSTLVLYTTKRLGFSSSAATAITGSFIAFNYALHLLGGYCGGRFLSYRSLFSIGMLLQIISCFLIAIPEISTLYWGLAAFLTGAGMNVTCVNCMLTQLFEPKDIRRESAFLWNYGAMNIGFLAGFTISGYFQLRGGYHQLFSLVGLGNFIALLIILFNWKVFEDKNTDYSQKTTNQRRKLIFYGLVIIVALFICLHFLLNYARLSNNCIMAAGALMAIVIAVIAVREKDSLSRNKVWAFWLLTLSALVFWMLYMVMPMGLTLFIAHNVNTRVMGFQVAPQWVMNINSIVIIIGAPLMTYFFNQLRQRGVNISLPLQFTLALILIGLGFVILPLGIKLADTQGFISFSWIVACYVLQSIGELFISPIGYSMIGYLAPVRFQGIFMGTWMLVIGVAATLSSYFSNLAISATMSVDPLITNPGFSHTFSLLGWAAIGAGVVLALMSPFLLKLTDQRKVKMSVIPR